MTKPCTLCRPSISDEFAQGASAAPARTRAGEQVFSLLRFFLAHGGGDSTSTTISYYWDNLRSRLPVNGSRIRVGVRANPLSQVRVNRVAMGGQAYALTVGLVAAWYVATVL